MSQRAVLISGASGGIGTATVERFLASGDAVLGLDLVEPAERPGLRAEIADVRDPAAVGAAVEELAGSTELSHVVGLAGQPLLEELGVLEQELPEAVEHFQSSLDLNLTGQFCLVRAALPRLAAASGDRSITLCSSINAFHSLGAPAYSAAKAGVIGMMKALAGPLGGRGIRINVVAPGTIESPGRRNRGDRAYFEGAAESTVLKRVGQPDEVAAAIEALAHRLTHVTGQVLRVDGGQMLAR